MVAFEGRKGPALQADLVKGGPSLLILLWDTSQGRGLNRSTGLLEHGGMKHCG